MSVCQSDQRVTLAASTLPRDDAIPVETEVVAPSGLLPAQLSFGVSRKALYPRSVKWLSPTDRLGLLGDLHLLISNHDDAETVPVERAAPALGCLQVTSSARWVHLHPGPESPVTAPYTQRFREERVPHG